MLHGRASLPAKKGKCKMTDAEMWMHRDKLRSTASQVTMWCGIIAVHSESAELMVIYHRVGYPTKQWARPLEMFLSPVDKQKYPDAAQERRFEVLTDENK